jgi:SAM-dependent methyltransferase
MTTAGDFPGHPTARGFDRAASTYEHARPDYPAAMLDWLVAELGAGSVLDVGAGTGKLTRALLARGLAVVAVEPMAGMRAALASSAAEADVREGVAESLPAPDASVDAVVAGQAFHWFANERALAEFARVLRPRGRLGLVWNARDLTQPLQRDIGRLMSEYQRDEPRHASGAWERALERSALFVRVSQHRLPHGQRLSREGVVDRVLSTSFIAALPEAEQARLADRVRSLAAAEPIDLAYMTEAFVYRLAG